MSDWCSAKNCHNSRLKESCRGLSFHKLPWRQESRCRLWIQRMGRDDLIGKSMDQVRRTGCKLCSVHFEPSQFTNPDAEKKQLVWNAVPSIFTLPEPLSAATTKIQGNEIFFGKLKLNKVKLKRLLVYMLEVSRLNIELLHSSLAGCQQKGKESLEEFEKLQELVIAIRFELQAQLKPSVSPDGSENESHFGPPPPPHPPMQTVGDGLVQKEQIHMDGGHIKEESTTASVGIDNARIDEDGDSDRDGVSQNLHCHALTQTTSSKESQQLKVEAGSTKLELNSDSFLDIKTQYSESSGEKVQPVARLEKGVNLDVMSESQKADKETGVCEEEEVGQWQGLDTETGVCQKIYMETEVCKAMVIGEEETCLSRNHEKDHSQVMNDKILFGKAKPMGKHGKKGLCKDNILSQSGFVYKGTRRNSVSVRGKLEPQPMDINADSVSKDEVLDQSQSQRVDEERDVNEDKVMGQSECWGNEGHISRYKTRGLSNRMKEERCVIKETGKGKVIKRSESTGKVGGLSKVKLKLKQESQVLSNRAEGPCVCEVCGKIMSNAISLQRHILRHREKDADQTYSCQVCGKQFKMKAYLRSHMRIHTGCRKYQCSSCGKCYYCWHSFSIHMRTHSGERPFVCSVCNKTFISDGNLKRHERLHTGERPWKCSYCDKSFIDSAAYKIHMRRHTGEKPFSCTLCDKSFSLKAYLKNHRDHSHGSPKNKVVNEKLCGDSSKCSYCLRKHPQVIPDAPIDLECKPYQCSLCEKAFFLKACLDHHMVIHNGYRCDLCNISFSHFGNLSRHIRNHSGARPYKCDVCGKDFTKKAILDLHMWTHRTDKKFTCQICGKGYNDKRTFTAHMKKHMKLTPLSLDPVHQGFIQETISVSAATSQPLHCSLDSMAQDFNVIQLQGQFSSVGNCQGSGYLFTPHENSSEIPLPLDKFYSTTPSSTGMLNHALPTTTNYADPSTAVL